MSLKAFHIFFVTVSMILTTGFGVWSILGWMQGIGSLWLGIVSLLITVILSVYLKWFLEKIKHESRL